MPVSYQIDKKLRTIHTRCSGEVTFGEVIVHFQALQQDSDCPEKLDVLLDLTECTSIPETNQLRAVGATIGSIRDKVRFDACAIVAPGDLIFGLSQMFLVFAEDQFRAAQVFRDANEAKKWLVSKSFE